jgi:glycosyltransferase involved in cell wall biosynthesis
VRIAILIDSLRIGGAQKLVADFAAARSTQIDPTLISLGKNPSPALRAVVESADVRLFEFPASSLLNLPRFHRLLDLFTSERFDVIHTHLVYANILGGIAGRLAKTPVIATIHTMGSYRDKKSARIRIVERLCLRYLSLRIVAVGHEVAEALGPSLDGHKLRIIPNGIPVPEPVSPEVRKRARQELAGDSRGPIIVAVGRFEPPKAYEDLVDAFALLHRLDPGPILAMVGGGSLFQRIHAQVESLGLQDCVRMLGPREDIPQLLSASDVFASSSHREGLPIAVLEGMMAGLPVVATDVGEMPRLVTQDIGRVVPPHRPDLLAQALGELLAVPDALHAMGQAAHRRAVLDYSIGLCVDRHIALYREVLDSRRRGRWTWQPSA